MVGGGPPPAPPSQLYYARCDFRWQENYQPANAASRSVLRLHHCSRRQIASFAGNNTCSRSDDDDAGLSCFQSLKPFTPKNAVGLGGKYACPSSIFCGERCIQFHGLIR
jgi:hypothetical protein